MSIHPDMTACRAVDACGGAYSTAEENSGYAQGHHDALTAAMEAVKPVDALVADLLTALKAMVLNDAHTYRDCHKAALRAIAKATGEASA